MTPNIAEKILLNLGITHPNDIDIDVIAWDQNVKVNRRPLSGCEARILGDMNKAVVSVNSNSTSERQRFSIAHELGHWQFDRGKTFICSANDMNFRNSHFCENQANQFAADLLFPDYLFVPRANKISQLNWNEIRILSSEFRASLTATAIRVISTNDFPSILALYKNGKRSWFRRSEQIPSFWNPRESVEIPASVKTGELGEYPVSADFWFNSEDFSDHEVTEDILPFQGGFLSLLTLNSEEMIELDESF